MAEKTKDITGGRSVTNEESSTDFKGAVSKESIINNNALHDSSSKLIFGDNILSSQFFRDYADMEILRYIQPEDIEDVSERYVPLYNTERESDTVKKVNISKYLAPEERENKLNLPLYIISLIEHKTKVEYNVVMQILRYMVYIWEDYEKEMSKRHPGISSRKDFRYPPILPIVYYEGGGSWTAPLDISERILCGELLGKYLPHFQYQLVMLHDYSNEDLLEKGDEISLAMLINKIQCPEDVTAFINLPVEQMDEILKDTPEYLLDTMTKVLRALLYNMNLPEKETEDVVSRIKERKMARLFENVKMDIQAERRERAEAERRLDDAEKRLEDTEKKLDDAVKTLKIYKLISKMQKKNCGTSEIKAELMKSFLLSEEQAENEYRKAMEEE